LYIIGAGDFFIHSFISPEGGSKHSFIFRNSGIVSKSE